MLRFLSKRYSTRRKRSKSRENGRDSRDDHTTRASGNPARSVESSNLDLRRQSPFHHHSVAEIPQHFSARTETLFPAVFHKQTSTSTSALFKTPRNVLQCRVELLDGVNYNVQLPVGTRRRHKSL